MKRVFKAKSKSLKHSLIIIIGIITVLNVACDDLLDAEPEDNVVGNIYNSQENIEKALNGAYYNFGGINDGVDGGELFGGDFILIPTLIVAQNKAEVSWDGSNGLFTMILSITKSQSQTFELNQTGDAHTK